PDVFVRTPLSELGTVLSRLVPRGDCLRGGAATQSLGQFDAPMIPRHSRSANARRPDFHCYCSAPNTRASGSLRDACRPPSRTRRFRMFPHVTRPRRAAGNRRPARPRILPVGTFAVVLLLLLGGTRGSFG